MKSTVKNMKAILVVLVCMMSFNALAQSPHSTPESRQKMKDRSDYSLFRRQAAALKEFAEERKKIPALQKENKETVKVFVTVDSIDTDDTLKAKFIMGYINQQVGETTNVAYELTFDRTQRRIITVKRTGESAEPEAAEEKEKKTSATAKKKVDATPKAPVAKKKKDPDGDDEEEDEKEEKEEKTPASKEKDE